MPNTTVYNAAVTPSTTFCQVWYGKFKHIPVILHDYYYQGLLILSRIIGLSWNFKKLSILFWTTDCKNQLYMLLWVWQNILNSTWLKN